MNLNWYDDDNFFFFSFCRNDKKEMNQTDSIWEERHWAAAFAVIIFYLLELYVNSSAVIDNGKVFPNA